MTTHRLSEHFTLDELTRTARPYPNEPSAAVILELERLCLDVLEPFRVLVGPLRVNSGYRSAAVNVAVGGAKKSAHLDGRAADVVPIQMTCRDGMLALSRSKVSYDRAIYERRTGLPWIHLQVRARPRGPRRELLMSLEPGVFEIWDPADPRLS